MRSRAAEGEAVFIGPAEDNLRAVVSALTRFGAPPAILEALRTLGPDEFLFLGASPVRVDLLRRVDGLSFAEADARRETAHWGGVLVSLVSFDDLITAKKAAGRERDLRGPQAARGSPTEEAVT